MTSRSLAILLVAASALAIIGLIVWAVTYGARIVARDERLNHEAVELFHSGELDSIFHIAPEMWHVPLGPPTFLQVMLAVTDEMPRCRQAIAADLAALRTITAAASEQAQMSADAMARALPALAPTVWAAFDSDHRPTDQFDQRFDDELDLQSYLNLEATIHAPHPRPLSDLSDSHVGVDWDAELQALLIESETPA